MRRASWLTMLVLAFAWSPAHAQLSATVSADTVAPGDVFTLIITAGGNNSSTPELPQSDDFVFMNANNPSTSMSVQFGTQQNRVVQTRSWTYQIHVDKEGVFTLPPINVTIDGKKFSTEPLKVTVSKDAPRPRAQPRRRSRFGFDPFENLQPQTRMPVVDEKIATEDLGVMELKADKQELYVGEPVTVTLVWGHLNSQGVSVDARIPPPQTPQGFFAAPDTTDRKHFFEKRNGNDYDLYSKEYTWFPTTPGDIVIPAIEVDFTIDRHTQRAMDRRVITKRTTPINLKVKALPPAPGDFSGAVGEFKISSSLPATDLLQGAQTQLVVKIMGSGNPASLSAPALPSLDWAHVSTPVADQAAAAAQGATKIFVYTLTPLQTGAHEIPELKFSYFSPASAGFQPAVAPAIKVNVRGVTPTAVAGNAAATKVVPGIQAPDGLAPIVRDAGTLGQAHSGLSTNLMVAVMPPLAYAGLFLLARHRRRLRDDKDFARDYFARSKSQKRLAGVRGAKDPTDALFRAVAGFVADKLHHEEAGLTSADARRAVAERGLPSELAAGIEKILRACERARYANVQLSPAEMSALLDAARTAMDELESELKKGSEA